MGMLIAMLVAILPATAYDFEVDGVYYNILSASDLTCEIVRGKDNPSGVITIPSKVQYQESELTVTKIGERAYAYLSNLKSVIIPNSITTIDMYAFQECPQLVSVSIPNSVISLGEGVFYGCGLTSIYIPSSISSIGEYAFQWCYDLQSIDVDSNNQNYTSLDGVLFNKNLTLLIQFPVGKGGDYTIPNTVTSIGNFAFYECESLISVNMTDNVTSIGNSAFEYCTGLISISLSNSLETIGECSFHKCTSLTSLVIPNSLSVISDEAFSKCRSLTTVIIPNSILVIGYSAFEACPFSSITIPASVEFIDEYAFSYCSNLKTIYYEAQNPISGYSNTFDNYNATLYVPKEAVAKCKRTNPWKNFNIIQPYEFSGIEDVEANRYDDKSCEVYSLGGIKHGNNLNGLAPGAYIVRKGTEQKKIVIK